MGQGLSLLLTTWAVGAGPIARIRRPSLSLYMARLFTRHEGALGAICAIVSMPPL